jgi:predicted DNA-binding protein
MSQLILLTLAGRADTMSVEVSTVKKQDTNTVIRISRDDLDRVKAHAKTLDRSASWVMREAIRLYVAKLPKVKSARKARAPKPAAMQEPATETPQTPAPF